MVLEEKSQVSRWGGNRNVVRHETSPSTSSTTLKPLTVWITTNCGKFFKRWECQTTSPASWETCMPVKKQQVEPNMELCLFGLYAEYIMQNARLDEAQAGIKIAGRNIINFRYADDTTHGRKWGRTKEPLDESERGEWKAGLKLSIQEMKIMASGPITPWQIDGETMKTVRKFVFLGSKITADGDCSHEINRPLLLERKAMTNLDRVLKSRAITLLMKVRLVKAISVSRSHVWMWELDHKEGWVPKNWCFCTVVLEKTLESLLDHKEITPVNPKGNQPWIFIERPDAESEAPVLQYLATWCEKQTH